MIAIKCYPKRKIESGKTGSKDKVLISIISTVETHLSDNIKEGYMDVLELVFDDLWLDPSGDNIVTGSDLQQSVEGTRVCDNSDLMKVKEFVDLHPKTDIDIHCAMGVSRSGAVAVGISMIYNDKKLWRWVLDNNNITPNERIIMKFNLMFNPLWGCMNFSNMWNILESKNNL